MYPSARIAGQSSNSHSEKSIHYGISKSNSTVPLVSLFLCQNTLVLQSDSGRLVRQTNGLESPRREYRVWSENMDPDILSVGAILVGLFAATMVFIWQINTQSSRLETKIDDLGKELRDEIETQGKELRTEIETQGRRVSDSELEQARLNGVNSVLMTQTHTHESMAD